MLFIKSRMFGFYLGLVFKPVESDTIEILPVRVVYV